MSETPLVLLIDDEPQESAAARLRQLGVAAEWLYPTEVDEAALADATLLAVDEYLELRGSVPPNDAPSLRAGLPLIAVPPDGLALSAVLRRAADGLERPRPVGITLRTGAPAAGTCGGRTPTSRRRGGPSCLGTQCCGL